MSGTLRPGDRVHAPGEKQAHLVRTVTAGVALPWCADDSGEEAIAFLADLSREGAPRIVPERGRGAGGLSTCRPCLTRSSGWPVPDVGSSERGRLAALAVRRQASVVAARSRLALGGLSAQRREALELRVAHPDASIPELAELAGCPPVAFQGRLQRAMTARPAAERRAS